MENFLSKLKVYRATAPYRNPCGSKINLADLWALPPLRDSSETYFFSHK